MTLLMEIKGGRCWPGSVNCTWRRVYRGQIPGSNWEKSLKTFLLAIHSHLYIILGNLKSENSKDYAQKPQQYCTFMNSASIHTAVNSEFKQPHLKAVHVQRRPFMSPYSIFSSDYHLFQGVCQLTDDWSRWYHTVRRQERLSSQILPVHQDFPHRGTFPPSSKGGYHHQPCQSI